MGGTHTGHSCQFGPRPDKATFVPPAAVGPRVLCDAGGGRGGSSRPPRALTQPWMMLFPESSLSSDGPGGFVPCSQSTPGPRDRGDTGGDTEGVHTAAPKWKCIIPRGAGAQRAANRPISGHCVAREPRPPGWGGPALLKCVKTGGEEGGAIAAPPEPDKGNRPGEVLFQLCSCFPGETLTLKLCATGEVTSVFKARI